MKFLDPRWLYLTVATPLILLLTAGYRQYTLVASLLPPETVQAWVVHGIILVLLLALTVITAAALDARQEPVGIVVALVLLVAVLFYATYGLAFTASDTLPDIDPWLVSYYPAAIQLGGMTLIGFYALAVLVRHSTAGQRPPSRLTNFGGLLIGPVGLYMLLTAGVPLLNGKGDGQHLLIMTGLALTASFYFFAFRAVYLQIRRKRGRSGLGRVMLFLLAIVLPLAGLAVNGLLGGGVFASQGMFGNFGHPVVYAVTLVNGVYVWMPRRWLQAYRLPAYFVGCVGTTFVTYFACVLLPYSPFAVLAVLLVGLGLLMLSPLLLLPVQIKTLMRDYASLRTRYPAYVLAAVTATGLLLLPAIITVDYAADRKELDRAMAYLYEPAAAEGEVDAGRLARVLRNIRKHDGDTFAMFDDQTPYLSEYYRWLVLDNLTLSTDKLNLLTRVFTDAPPADEPANRRTPTAEVSLTAARATTTFDEAEGVYASWIDLEMTADTTPGIQGEYDVTFALPAGAFVDDYYLDVVGERKYGLLAERRAATWVYNRIVGTRRDPGLLRYADADHLRLSVFPFRSGETRCTGFRVLHAGPTVLAIDGHTVQLGHPEDATASPVLPVGVRLFSAKEKETLPAVHRQPRLHFVVDPLQRSDDPLRFGDAVDKLVAALPAGAPPPTITLAGIRPRQYAYTTDWRQQIGASNPNGFFAQRGIEMAALGGGRDTDTYPVVVVVGSDPLLTADPKPFFAHVPEGMHLYYLDGQGALRNKPIRTDTHEPAETFGIDALSPSRIRHLREGNQDYYLSADDDPSIVYRDAPAVPVGEHTVSHYAAAVGAYTRYLDHARTGRTGHGPWLTEVTESFRYRILLPTTAMLVVENAAQEEALRRKQEEVLAGDPRFDLEEVTSMDEPGWWFWLLAIPLLYTIAPARRRRKPV